jgi:colicin import membrane protein
MKKEAVQTSARGISGSNPETHKLIYFIAISAVLHLVFMAGIILAPALAPAKRYIPTVVNVSLVSLPALGNPTVETAGPEKQEVQEPPAEKVEIKPEPVEPPPPPPPPPKPVEKVSIEPVPKVSKTPKESLKHKTFKPSTVVKESVTKLAKEVEEKRPPTLDDTLKRLKREVESTAKNPRSGATGPVGTPDGRTGRSGMTSAQEQDRVRIYQAEIAYQVQKNWAFSEQLAGARADIEVALGIKIAADGEISDIWFDQRSGNRHLDESAYRAIVKSNPLPPFPQGLFGSQYTVGLRFGPGGIK